MKNSVLLAFPPVWMPEAPFLSTAILSAYLKEREIDVVQRDLNVEFWLHFEEEPTIIDIYRRSQRKWKLLSSRETLNRHEFALLTQLAPISQLPQERFVYEVQERIISRESYRKLIQTVGRFQVDRQKAERLRIIREEEVQNYHDLLYSDISHSLYAHATEGLRLILEDKANPFRAYFQRVYGRGDQFTPSVLGLSIAAINQVVPAFTLASLVKQWSPRTHIVIGGSWCTQVHESLAPKLSLFPEIDSMVIYEGEEPLYQLCSRLERGESLEGIPNLYSQREICVSPPIARFTMDMNRLPTPDFTGLPLAEYNFPRTLTLQSSRGCYWGKCTFCSYPLLEPEYKARKTDKLVDDIRRLQGAYGVEDIGFTDALLSPSFCRRLSAALLCSNLSIRWAMFARFEKQFTPDLLRQMAQSGCSLVSWGLESGNSEILETIEKSISLSHAEEILTAAAEYGIHNRVLAMYGHPTETFPQALETINFLRHNLTNIHSISYNYYHPEMGTPVERLAARLGIQLARDHAQDLSFGYHWESCLNNEEKFQIKEFFEDLARQLAMRQRERGTDSRIVPLPSSLLDGENSFTVSIPGDSGRVTLLSTLVDRPGGKQREAFVVQEF